MDIQAAEKKKNIVRLSVIINTVLTIVKLIVGFVSGSVSIISEAVHSAVDLLAALVAWYAVKKAGKPPDIEHEYGHGKYENMSATFEAMLIMFAAVWIVYEACERIRIQQLPEFLEYGILIMGVSTVLNYWIATKLYKVGIETGSQAIQADALHHRADVWTSIGVLLGLAVIKVTGLVWIDACIAGMVALVIFKAGYAMTKDNVSELLDVSLPQEEEDKIIRIINNETDVQAYHRLRTRRSGSSRLIDVHILLAGDMLLEKAHAISDRLEAAIKAELGTCDVVVHLEPSSHKEVGKLG